MEGAGDKALSVEVLGRALHAIAEVEENDAALVALLTQKARERLEFVLHRTVDHVDLHPVGHLLALVEKTEPAHMPHIYKPGDGLGIGSREQHPATHLREALDGCRHLVVESHGEAFVELIDNQ